MGTKDPFWLGLVVIFGCGSNFVCLILSVCGSCAHLGSSHVTIVHYCNLWHTHVGVSMYIWHGALKMGFLLCSGLTSA